MGISRRTALGFIAGNEKATEKVYGEYKNLMFFVIAPNEPAKEYAKTLVIGMEKDELATPSYDPVILYSFGN